MLQNENIYLLDYGAGNTASLVNAVESLGYSIQTITSKHDFLKADRLIFPGVGSFGSCMSKLAELDYIEPLLDFLRSGKPFMGICVGMQLLFSS
jgi:glutamine amidotransferase/cyclase